MNKKTVLSMFAAIFMAAMLMFSCEEEMITENGKDFNPVPTVYQTNPYEWVGELHNSCLDYLMIHVDSSIFSGNWIDANFIDSCSYYADEYFSVNGIIPYNEILNDSIAEDWCSFENPDSLVNRMRTEIINANHISQQDSLFGMKVLDLAVDMMDNNYSNQTMIDKVNSLESEMLLLDWDSTEVFALMSLSLYKASLDYHIYNTIELDINKNYGNSILHFDRKKEATCAIVDYVVGAGVFLSGTAATSGVGVLVALKAGSSAGSVASFVARSLGTWFGWWDFF